MQCGSRLEKGKINLPVKTTRLHTVVCPHQLDSFCLLGAVTEVSQPHYTSNCTVGRRGMWYSFTFFHGGLHKNSVVTQTYNSWGDWSRRKDVCFCAADLNHNAYWLMLFTCHKMRPAGLIILSMFHNACLSLCCNSCCISRREKEFCFTGASGFCFRQLENERAGKHTFFKGGKTVQRRAAFKRYHTVDVEYEHWLVIHCISLQPWASFINNLIGTQAGASQYSLCLIKLLHTTCSAEKSFNGQN